MQIKSNSFKGILKLFSALFFLFIFGYLVYLNDKVSEAFSKPVVNTSNTFSQTLDYEQYPKALVNMLLLIEDQSFFQHSGVDFKEIARVIRDYLWHDKPIRGASTITQQLIKNTLLTPEQSLSRKLKEVIMAWMLESSFTKEFILQRYMNSVYLGQKGNHEVRGFASAAEFYFHRQLNKLSLEEFATLVALVKGPSYYHPIKHPNRLAKRKQLVLKLYKKYKKIVE